MTAENALELRSILLKVVQTESAKLGRGDAFGQRYTLNFTLEWQNKSAIVRSGWIIEVDSQIP